MSLPDDELRAGGARLVRGTGWTIVILLGLGTVLHVAGILTLSPLVATTAVVLIGVTRWYARALERREQPDTTLFAFHLVFIVGITIIAHGLGGIRFPPAMLFFAMLVVNSGFSPRMRYAIANMSACAYALMVGLEQAGWIGRAAGAFPASLVPTPPWPEQLATVATFAVSLNLLATITHRLMALLALHRQHLTDANRELETWRVQLAELVRTRTQELEAANRDLGAVNRDLDAANRELDARARALEERGRHLRTFVYTVTHDLKTPVNNVLLISDLMLQRDGDRLATDMRRDIERIAQHAARTEHMIGDLFALFQISSTHEAREWLRAETVVQGVLDDLAPQIAAKEIAVHVGTLPRVWAAPGKLHHVLANLVTNAVKHVPTATGAVTLTGSRLGDWVRLSVQDNGPGIAPEYHQRIFELFGRVPSGDQPADGTGVGLAIAHTLVEIHGGRLWVESVPNAGATFHVELPAPPDDETIAAPA